LRARQNNHNEKVEEMLPSFAKAWRQLDDRKISAPLLESSSQQGCGGDDIRHATTNKHKSTKKPFWFENHVHFPEFF
jgi:hypothetical protein